MRQSYLVCYDISDDKRLRKVFKTMRGYGDHLQYSVFECHSRRAIWSDARRWRESFTTTKTRCCSFIWAQRKGAATGLSLRSGSLIWRSMHPALSYEEHFYERAAVPSPRTERSRNRSRACPAPDYLPARMVNEFVYCPRLYFYKWVEGVFRESADTVEGSAQHKRVDARPAALPEARCRAKEKIHARSVTLSSERLKVIAKLDLVEAEGTRNSGGL